ncbi:right-handed parallel beta-helix repeat-containing protein [Asticcacaulis sp. EMRT-3]|uniref:right-handed parallel beta-helix repeat-containing protein n=1 Tax=Asticcacaulis sp. EMRT-3 TaxID=3040349 RepID=UPI0024AF567F|nr:right-handed parallel beta-helix repeat-containing protein [Asticcacaulis sp. EMRT-3]MDI7775865.1 right-handed parallel beta-helix repeat-containing protein [Asticcacaulis sp. EMRT-3]
MTRTSRRATLRALLLPVFILSVRSAPAFAELPPAPQIPVVAPPKSDRLSGGVHLALRPAPVPAMIYVSPQGSDENDGSSAHPFATLARAQMAVRGLNQDHDVTVSLGDGVYRLDAPLRFTAADGGQNGFKVRYQAAPGAHPVLSGGMRIADWSLADQGRNIWVADMPRGMDPRQIWVNEKLSRRALVIGPRNAFEFYDWGLKIVDPAWDFLSGLPDQSRLEIENLGWFTDRHATIQRIEGDRIMMQQPGWRDNIIGYDTLARPVSPDNARLEFVNSLAFLRNEGEWYADPKAGKIYYKPRKSEVMASADVEVPHLEWLMSISGAYERPVADLDFTGLSFEYTSWLQPSGPNGYASQQSGAYIAGEIPNYPKDPIRDCSWGCPAFEAMRNRWSQQPAAIQVSAAERITFSHDQFTHLGQIGLGIGNNADANASGIGLGASTIDVVRSRFSDLAGGAIMVGGVTPDAHHPSRPEMTVADILISNNLVQNISQDYHEQAAIMVTYAAGAVISHNDVSQAPYDGIDTGWGWGANDPGGSAAYRTANRDYYDQPGNLVYNTPTILHDTVVFANRVHEVKQSFPDGGAIYHLSADPGALIAENYVYDVPGGIALYLDEGSRYVTVRNNVVSHVGIWLNLNSQDNLAPRRTAMDNVAKGNWYDSGLRSGSWADYLNNQFSDNTEVKGDTWPQDAQAVIARSGIEPEMATQK